MTANEKRKAVHDKYKGILGRNKYSQDLRTYVNTKYKDGKYYSDCSSSVSWAYKAAGYPIKYGSTTLPSTVGLYNSKDLVDVPVTISKGQIKNPEVLRVGDLLLFAGTDSSRKGSGYVGHVEMVASINGSKITIYGHGSGTPRETEMTAYLKKRYGQKTSKTSLGHKGLIKVRRRFADDGSEPAEPKLGDRTLKDGCIGSDVRDLQKALIAQGYSCGSCGADGEFGPDTAKAVKKFQTAKGLSATGVADAATIAALTGTSSNTTPTAPSGPTVTIANCKECNLRAGPGTQYKSEGTAKAGESFPAVENPDGWVPVLIDGQVRWISGKYAHVEG